MTSVRAPSPPSPPAVAVVRERSWRALSGPAMAAAAAAATGLILAGRLHGFGGETIWVAAGAGLIVLLVGLPAPVRLVTVRDPDRLAMVIGIGAVVGGWLVAGLVGSSHPLIAVAAELAATVAAGCSMAWDPDDGARLAVGPAFGIVGGVVGAAIVGATLGMRGPAWVCVPLVEVVGIRVAGRLRARRAAPAALVIDAGAVLWEAVTVAIVIGMAIAFVFVAYHALHPAVPFGRDLQHPTNLSSLLRAGRPAAGNAGSDVYYPTTVWYWLAALAAAAHLGPLTILEVGVPLLWVLSSVAVFCAGRVLLGRRAAIAAMIVYALCSFQPKQTLLDGTDIGVLSEYVLMPLALVATYLLVTRRDRWTVAAWAICAGGLIQVHFLAFSRFALVAVPLLAASLLVVRPRQEWFNTLLNALVGAAVVGLPYSSRYAAIYFDPIAKAVGLSAPTASAGVYPLPAFPGAYTQLLGPAFFWAAVVAAGAWMVAGALGMARRAEWWVLTLWTGLVGAAAATGLLVAAERDLRALALPGALLIGWLVDVLTRSVTPRLIMPAMSCAVALALVRGAPAADSEYLSTAAISIYSTPAVQTFLGSVPWPTLAGRVVTDESGVWVPYFAGLRTVAVAGGPETFKWFGQPQEREMAAAWAALRPCGPASANTLLKMGIDYVFLGPPPTHWTPPGYTYEPPTDLLACRGFSVVLADRDLGEYLFVVS